MRKVKYTNWWAFKKKEQSIESVLSKMDLNNKTSYLSRKIKDENLLEEAAFEAHENGGVYYVTIFDIDKPYCFIDVNKGFYRVSFLDEYQRKYLSYDFYGQDTIAEWRKNFGEKLFLEKVTYWEFQGNTDKVLKTTNYIFKPDGSFVIVERDLIKNEQLNRSAQEKIDVAANWEEYPEFGNYDSIIRKERDIKMYTI